MTIKVKICGLKTREAVETADQNGAEFLGFIFAEKSPRYITPVEAGKISQNVKAKKVAVVVDASDELLADIITHLQPDYIQLHGNENDERAEEIIAKFGAKLIKAYSVERVAYSETKRQTLNAKRLYDFLLFDSPGGGTGKQFDYSGFQAPSQPWFLSGGLNIENLAEAVKTTGAIYVDVSSGVESERGVKSIEKIKEFLKKALSLR
jgi:phosphoribosylanthranilate isomerase